MKTKLVVLCTLALSLVAGAETAFNPLNVGGIGAVVGVTHDELNAAVESLEAKDAQLSVTLGNVQQRKADKATTLSGYDIGDAYIQDSTIYLGSQSLRPLLYTEGYIDGNTVHLRGTSRTFLTQHQSLADYATVASVNTLAGRVTNVEAQKFATSRVSSSDSTFKGAVNNSESDPVFTAWKSSNQFSTDVLAAGLSISTDAKAWLEAVGALDPTTGAVSLGTLLSALLAALIWLKTNKADKSEAVTVIKLTDSTETMASILARLTAGATDGRYPLFDPSAFAVNPAVKLISVDIDAANGSLHIQDVSTGRLYIGSYVATDTIQNVLSKMVAEYVALVVSATRKDGEAVSGVNVYLYEGADETGRLVETKPYNGSPVSFRVGGGFEYFVKIDEIDGLFQPTTASGTADNSQNISLVYGDANHITTFEDVKLALNALGTVEAAKAVLVYKKIADTWTDLDASGNGDNDTTQYPEHPLKDANGHPIYDDPMVCTNVEMVEDADGNQHLAAIMMRLYATANKIQFDAPNTEEATEETAQAGITYYGMATGQTTPSTSNLTVLSLADGDPIPYSSYAKVYKNAYNDSTKNLLIYGHNRYEASAYRKYLCADKSVGAGQWWSQGHIGQVRPDEETAKLHPYQAGCSAALLAAIKPIKRVVASNTVCDGGQNYQICDPFWLPAVREMYGTTSTQEGSEQEEYWQNLIKDSSVTPNNNTSKVNAVRKQYQVTSKNGSAVNVRLRSASVSYSYYVYNVNASGIVSYSYTAKNACAGLPACAIY